MAPRLAKTVRETIEVLVGPMGETDDERIAAEFHTTERSVQRIRKGWKTRNTLGVDLRSRPGRKSKVTPTIKEFVVELLARDSTLHQDKIADYVYIEYGVVKLYQSQVSKLCKELKHSNKRVRLGAAQRDAELRREFRNEALGCRPEQLVFLDEFSAKGR